MEGKIVFVNETKLLIIEIQPISEIQPFLCGILLNLTLDSSSIEQPIKVSFKAKERVINFLNRKYSKKKRVNGLIKFFRDLPISSYIYIYPYCEQLIEYYDTMKESLLYYNKGEKEEIICLKMKEYMEMKKEVQKYLDDAPYEIQMIIPNKKITEGEKDKQKRKCIYCGGNINDGITRYKEIAHAIPEALGNIKFIQNEECDTCNDYFARNAEEDLCNFLIWKRLQYGLKGKNGYPIFQLTKDMYVKYFDYERENYEVNWGCFESVKTFVKENKIKCPIIISASNGLPKHNDKIDISYIKEYIPQHVYKTLVKCVIGLIGNEHLVDFQKTIKWLRYNDDYVELPKVFLIKCKRLILEPELYIFKRKEINNYRIPYCYGELRILDTIFVFIIPFTENDRFNFIDKNENKMFMSIISKTYGKKLVKDFSDIAPKKIEEQFIIYSKIF